MAEADHLDPQTHLRLIWPQWQGAGSTSVRALTLGEFDVATARRGYALGTRVLEAILPPHDGPTARVPVPMDDTGLDSAGGIEARAAVFAQLDAALSLIREHAPERITTLGGDCGVSVAPFASLIARYGDDLAIVWVDSHPDSDTHETAYAGYHAMGVAALTGHGDPELLRRLPAVTDGARVALAGMHDWTDPAHSAAVADRGVTVFEPDELRASTAPLLAWLRATGCTKVALHFDVDTIDADEVQLGLGFDRGGLALREAQRVVADVSAASDVVGLTIAEYVPRQAMHLRELLAGFPLLD